MGTVVIDRRFNGIPEIALGGYVGGLLARGRRKAEATFLRPVQLAKEYRMFAGTDGTIVLKDEDKVLVVTREATLDIESRESVEFEACQRAAEGYIGHKWHPFPTCFVCGPSRSEGDGLRIFPGVVAGRDLVAAPWTPAESLKDPDGIVESQFVWSALDCPTIWAFLLCGDQDSKDMAVTAKLAVELISPVQVKQQHIVLGWMESETDQMRVAGGAIYSEDGQLRAVAKHTLVTTSWGVPMGLNYWRRDKSR